MKIKKAKSMMKRLRMYQAVEYENMMNIGANFVNFDKRIEKALS